MVAIIGDIHGCFNTLKDLVSKVRDKYPNVQIYSVGDLIDRGNFSFEVVEFIIDQKIRFTPGNHDYMFYYFVKEPMSDMGRSWLYNGYESTLKSYDDHFEKIAEHFDHIKNAPFYFNLNDCFISHAGISKIFKSRLPKNYKENFESIEEIILKNVNNERGVLWTRDELLDLGKLQVVGHTRKSDILHLKKNNSLYIDTSAYAGNKLSAAVVEENHLLDIISVTTYDSDIE